MNDRFGGSRTAVARDRFWPIADVEPSAVKYGRRPTIRLTRLSPRGRDLRVIVVLPHVILLPDASPRMLPVGT